jgi:hypothetical protein
MMIHAQLIEGFIDIPSLIRDSSGRKAHISSQYSICTCQFNGL